MRASYWLKLASGGRTPPDVGTQWGFGRVIRGLTPPARRVVIISRQGRRSMRTRILDLDGSVCSQERLVKRYQPVVQSREEWGPLLRLACSHGLFRRFELTVSVWLRCTSQIQPALTFSWSSGLYNFFLPRFPKNRGPSNFLR